MSSIHDDNEDESRLDVREIEILNEKQGDLGHAQLFAHFACLC